MRPEDVKIDFLISADGRRWELIHRRVLVDTKEVEMDFRSEDGQNIRTLGSPAVYTSNADIRKYLLKALEGAIAEAKK